MYLNDICYSIKTGKLYRLSFEIHNISDADLEKIEKILDNYTKKEWKYFLTEKKKEIYKGGFLKRKDIKDITYLIRGFSKSSRSKSSSTAKDTFKHYISFESEPTIHGYDARLYINFPKNKGFRILENIVKTLFLK